MSGTLYSPEDAQNVASALEKKDEPYTQFMHGLMHDTLTKLSVDPSVPQQLRNKLHETIMSASIQEVMGMNGPDDDKKNIFNITDISTPKLTVEDQVILSKLTQERMNSYLNVLLGSEKKRQNRESGNVAEETLEKSKERLDMIMKEYHSNLAKSKEMLEKMIQMRKNEVAKVCASKIAETRLQRKLNESKVTLMQVKSQVQVVNENEVSMEAYRKLLHTIQDQKEEYAAEVRALKEHREKFKMAECQEHRDILNEYVQYKMAISRNERMAKLLNKK